MLASYKEKAAALTKACSNYKKNWVAHFISSVALASCQRIKRSQSTLQRKAI